jgi:hypothetical protein
MCLYIEAHLPCAKFMTVIGSAYPQTNGGGIMGFRPMWVFQKRRRQSRHRAQYAQNLLREHYGALIM